MKTSFEKFMASSAVNPINVELALIDDVNAIRKQAVGAVNLLYKNKQQILSDIANTEKFAGQFEAIVSKMKIAAKELGTEINPNYEKELATLKSVISDYKTKVKSLSTTGIF